MGVNKDIPVIQTLIDHWAACFVAFLFLVALTFAADRLGLIAWLAWLDCHKRDRHGKATKEYWRIHQ